MEERGRSLLTIVGRAMQSSKDRKILYWLGVESDLETIYLSNGAPSN